VRKGIKRGVDIMVKKVVLAYSGGLDTSVIIPWLKENYGCEVIALALDLGQGDELRGLKSKAKKSGASKCYILDVRREFIEDYIYPTIKAGAVYESRYLLGTSFARPLIAKKQVEIARKEKADGVAHGATGKGNDQVRFELTYMALNPRLKVIAPWKDDMWEIRSREDALAYAKARKIPIRSSKGRVYSEDANIYHISHEGEELEDPAKEPRDMVYKISNTPEKAPSRAQYVTVEFKKGIPVAVNGRKMGALSLMTALNRIGAKHGVGQIDIVENRLVGMKSRGVYETPGGTILYWAHRNLEELVMDRDLLHYKDLVAKRYAELVYDGKWFTPLKAALDAFVDKTQEVVTGKVKLKLYKGNIRAAGVTSPHSLYMLDLSSFKDDLKLYDQKDAKGFIRLFGLPMRTRALLKKKR
jgi:argininosuccinate synthase